jgi:hypothetical protein
MGYSHYDAAARGRAAWNAGKTVGTKRPLTQKQIGAICFFLDREERVRWVGSGRPVFGGQNGIVDIRPYGKSLDGAFPESFHNLTLPLRSEKAYRCFRDSTISSIGIRIEHLTPSGWKLKSAPPWGEYWRLRPITVRPKPFR